MLPKFAQDDDLTDDEFDDALADGTRWFEARIKELERNAALMAHFYPLFEGMPDNMSLRDYARLQAGQANPIALEFLRSGEEFDPPSTPAGNLPAELAYCQARVARVERLVAIDPSNAQWQRDLSYTRGALSKLPVE